MDNEKGIVFSSLDEVLKNSMIPYAENVIMDRALPVSKSQKSPQKKLLFFNQLTTLNRGLRLSAPLLN